MRPVSSWRTAMSSSVLRALRLITPKLGSRRFKWMLDVNLSTGSTPSQLDASTWLIAKMCARLLLRVIRVRLAIKIAPKVRAFDPEGLFRVECGEWTLHVTARTSDPSSSKIERASGRERVWQYV